MSASREKRLRKSSEGTPVKNNKAQKKKKITIWCVSILCVALVIVLIGSNFLLSSSWPHNNITAVTVGDKELTAADMNYYYRAAESTWQSNLGDYSNSFMSMFTEEIMSEAVYYAQQAYSLYYKALEAGFTLTDEEKAEIEDYIETLDVTASFMNPDLKNANDYLEYYYGTGCNTENYKEYEKVGRLGQKYLNSLLDAYAPSESDKQAYYQEHMEEIDTVSYHHFYITVDDTMTLEKAKAEGERMAKEAKEDPASFATNAYELAPENRKTTYENPNATKLTGVKISLMTEEYMDASVAAWLKDPARQSGDATVIVHPDESRVHVLYFLERDKHDYTAQNVRAILVAVQGTDEEAAANAKTEAQKYLDEYLNGEKTEEAFAALANSHSDDGVKDGLHENVGKNAFDEEISLWIYDAQRKAGDTTLIETEDGAYVVLYCGEGENFWDITITKAMEQTYTADKIAEICAAYPVKSFTRGLKYITQTTQYAYNASIYSY